MIPNFFILGAPKCGTTSLAAWLGRHPEVFFSPVKEPYFFNTDHYRSNRITEAEYRRLFDGVGSRHRAIGEGTVWYLLSRDAVPNIERIGRPRYIVCLRNPVDMAVSLFHEMRFNGSEPAPTLEAAWREQERRRQGPCHLNGTDISHLQYGKVCRLGEQLDRLYELVGRERVHVVFLDDLRSDPSQEFRKVLAFLGLETTDVQYNHENPAKARRSFILQRSMRTLGYIKGRLGLKRSFGILPRLSRYNHVQRAYTAPSDEMRRRLRAYFQDDVSLLAQLTGRDLSGWK